MIQQFSFILLVLCFQEAVSVEMHASINMAGYSGSVTFKRVSIDVNVLLQFTMGESFSEYDTVELWSLPAVFGRSKTSTQVCESGIGTKLQDLLQTSTNSTITSLAGSSYYHRSVLISSSLNPAKPKLCGTILPTTDTVTSYRAKFMGPVVGTVWLRNLSTIGTFAYGDLVMGDATATSQRDLVMYSTGSVNDTPSFAQRCSGLSGTKSVVATNITVEGSTSGLGTFGVLVSSISAFESNLAVVTGTTISACAILRTVEKKIVTSTMNWEEIKGSFVFSQSSPFDATETVVNLNGLQSRTSGYHVHKFPVAQRLSASEKPCDAAYVSGHFNPYSIDAGLSPTAGNGSNDEHEIGDLSGKYGNLAGFSTISQTYADWNLPLFGSNSIVGRSMVIHNADGSRLLCSSIGYPTTVKTGITVFKSPAYGTMYFRQDELNPDADTTVFVELASQSKEVTSNHNWHVHIYPVDDDAFDAAAPCASAGGHYNPSAISVADPYSTECQVDDPLRCELGDLSRRLGKINIVSTQRTEAGKFFFTDEYLPLSGVFSMLGRSIVVHGAEAASARYACANITQLHPVLAQTNSAWVGTSDGTVSGQVTLEQATEFDLTMVSGSFSNLANLASGYHIHEFTINTSVASGSECSASSVSGHYNPFAWTNLTIAATSGSYDQYEVGDLSNKYGLLDDQTTYSIPAGIMDTNLPLHTSLSSVDRSIVIHKKDANARWKCSNIMSVVPANSEGHIVSATVTISTLTLTGTIKLRQIIYTDGGAGLTTYELNIWSTASGNTLQHDWQIHEDTVSSNGVCSTILQTYDPYFSSGNSSDCSYENPLFCKVGDLSSKQAKYDIGGGRKTFHDVDTPLHTNYTVLGRSIFLLGQDGGSGISACGNIVPDDHTYTLAFSSNTAFNRYAFTKEIADGLGISRLRVIIINNVDVPVIRGGCSSVMIHIAGGGSLPDELIDSLLSGSINGMSSYAPTSACASYTGHTLLGESSNNANWIMYNYWMAVIAFLVTLVKL